MSDCDKEIAPTRPAIPRPPRVISKLDSRKGNDVFFDRESEDYQYGFAHGILAGISFVIIPFCFGVLFL